MRRGWARLRLETALSFLAEVDDAVAGEVVSLGWGTGVFDRRRPLVWDANYVRVAAAAELSATELAEAGEPLFSERGLAHRTFVFSDTHQAERLPGGSFGWVGDGPRGRDGVEASAGRSRSPGRGDLGPGYEESKRALGSPSRRAASTPQPRRSWQLTLRAGTR